MLTTKLGNENQFRFFLKFKSYCGFEYTNWVDFSMKFGGSIRQAMRLESIDTRLDEKFEPKLNSANSFDFF